MKLQKQEAYKYKDTIHYKYAIIIPENTIKALGWKEGDELKAEGKNGKMVVEKES